VVGEARSGREAITGIEELQPDLVFLDVQMPEGDGFEVVQAVGVDRMPVVIFATAYNEHALQAFEAHALDYLVKPYDRERFEAALRRARLHVQRARDAGVDARLASLVREWDGRSRYLSRLTVRVGSRIRLVEVGEVDYFEAATNYVRVHSGNHAHLVRDTLTALETRLDPAQFLRVHRSLIVNLGRILEVESLFAGEYVLFLRDGKRLVTGRTYRSSVQDALGLRP
jgi:two-component system LytT family response regulator